MPIKVVLEFRDGEMTIFSDHHMDVYVVDHDLNDVPVLETITDELIVTGDPIKFVLERI